MTAVVVDAIVGWTRHGFGFFQVVVVVVALLVGVQLRVMYRMFTGKRERSTSAG